jgi:threonylcarbamoyladenosine tRNA methylthiotransferase MtaB
VFDQEPLAREFAPGSLGRSRAFVKVQEGCNNRCTFCVTTIARGPGRSRPLDDVVREIQALVEAGYQEAVLTGVHLGSYGHDLKQDHGAHTGLDQLVRAILADTDIPRLRLSSLEPWDLALDFFTLHSESASVPAICICRCKVVVMLPSGGWRGAHRKSHSGRWSSPRAHRFPIWRSVQM